MLFSKITGRLGIEANYCRQQSARCQPMPGHHADLVVPMFADKSPAGGLVDKCFRATAGNQLPSPPAHGLVECGRGHWARRFPAYGAERWWLCRHLAGRMPASGVDGVSRHNTPAPGKRSIQFSRLFLPYMERRRWVGVQERILWRPQRQPSLVLSVRSLWCICLSFCPPGLPGGRKGRFLPCQIFELGQIAIPIQRDSPRRAIILLGYF